MTETAQDCISAHEGLYKTTKDHEVKHKDSINERNMLNRGGKPVSSWIQMHCTEADGSPFVACTDCAEKQKSQVEICLNCLWKHDQKHSIPKKMASMRGVPE